MATIDLVDYWDFADQVGNTHTFDCTNYAYDPNVTGTFDIVYVSPATRWIVGRKCYRLHFIKGDTNPTKMYWAPQPWRVGDQDCVWYVHEWTDCAYENTQWIGQWGFCHMPYDEAISSEDPPANLDRWTIDFPLCPWAHCLNVGCWFSKRYLDTSSGYRLETQTSGIATFLGCGDATLAHFGTRDVSAGRGPWFLDVQYVGDSYTCGSYTGKTIRVRTKDVFDDGRRLVEDWYLQEGRGVVRLNQSRTGTWMGTLYSNPDYDDDDLHLHDKGGSNPLDDNSCGIASTCSNIA